MSQLDPNEEVSAELIMRLHKATGLPVIDCRRVLMELCPNDRERIVAEHEAGRRFLAS